MIERSSSLGRTLTACLPVERASERFLARNLTSTNEQQPQKQSYRYYVHACFLLWSCVTGVNSITRYNFTTLDLFINTTITDDQLKMFCMQIEIEVCFAAAFTRVLLERKNERKLMTKVVRRILMIYKVSIRIFYLFFCTNSFCAYLFSLIHLQ